MLLETRFFSTIVILGLVIGSLQLPVVAELFSATLPATLRGAKPGIWLSPAEIACLPTSGPAWQQVKAVADSPAGAPTLRDQDSMTNVNILAKALVYVRLQQPKYRDEVAAALEVITLQNTERGGRTLALGRELAAYVIAADLIQLAEYRPELDKQFRQKLRELLDKYLAGTTLRATHEWRPNNWGTHAGATRAAIAVYLGDQAELERTATIFRGWLGDLSAYHGFSFGQDRSWQADPQHPVAVNPVGATKKGHAIDGALPEEMRRGGAFQWPPQKTGYAWEALQGATVQAEILQRANYPAWEWQEQALLRAVKFLQAIDWPPEDDDRWQAWLINHAYGLALLPTEDEATPGKNMGWTNWTHAGLCEAASAARSASALHIARTIFTPYASAQ